MPEYINIYKRCSTQYSLLRYLPGAYALVQAVCPVRLDQPICTRYLVVDHPVVHGEEFLLLKKQ